ncbi:ATP-binding protein [Arthrobacter oryzae]|uniref:sensor histidine kinase n=1 Tax=Arthrobacter oryzae TaxID=409290 RepID=UPI0028580647|nr:ATP-binding protein [Arthrobacter oryzae]MDR6508063.1 signal transduction histidine kinase [Arthrobacter oryzae]
MVGIPATIIWTALVRHPGRQMRAAAGISAALILISFLLWHVGLIGHGGQVASRPWSWGIAGIGIALACIASEAWISAIYGAVFSTLVCLVPLTTAGNARAWYESGQDALLTAAMAVVIISPISALRSAADAADRAAAAAILKTAGAAQAEALRIERTRLDGLTHDTVMATLTIAARARSTEMMYAAAQAARDSLKQLDSLRVGDEQSAISTAELVGRLKGATAGYSTRITCTDTTNGMPLALPLLPSRALIQATAEAVRNSARHAYGGGSQVEVTLGRDPHTGAAQAVIEITDEGPGFDIDKVPAQRLGLRVSILNRMRDAHGTATVTSKPGTGTRVQLTWKENPSEHE